MDPGRRRNKTKFYLIGAAVIILLLVIVILHLIPVTSTYTKTFEFEEVVDDGSGYEEFSQEVCGEHEFLYEDVWLGWDASNNEYVNPILNITNLEAQGGRFRVEMGFFDESETAYSTFYGISDFSDAKLFSGERSFYIAGGETVTVTIPTRKKDSSISYWAIGDIRPPVLEDCREVIERKEIETEQRTVTSTIEKEISEEMSLFKKLFGFEFF